MSVWNYYYGIPKAPGLAWKGPLIKKRLLSHAVKATVPLKDWYSHIKSAPWTVLAKLYERQMYGYFFFSAVFSFQWFNIIKNLILGFFLFVALVTILKDVLSFHSFSDLLTATGFVVHVFLFRAIIQNAVLSFWQALKHGNEKWLTQFSSSSFSFALLLSKTCMRWSRPRTHQCTCAHAGC